MKKIIGLLMFLLVFPVSCFAAYPYLAQSFGCYEESMATKEVMSRYGNWKSREVIFMAANEQKPSLIEIIRVSEPKDGVVTKKVEIGIANEREPKVPNSYVLNIVYTKLYHIDASGNVIDKALIETRTNYDMYVPDVDNVYLELWNAPSGNNAPRLLDEIRLVKKTTAPPEEMDEDLQKFWNVYR